MSIVPAKHVCQCSLTHLVLVHVHTHAQCALVEQNGKAAAAKAVGIIAASRASPKIVYAPPPPPSVGAVQINAQLIFPPKKADREKMLSFPVMLQSVCKHACKLVCAWSTCGVCVEYMWCVRGVHVVCAWSTCGVCVEYMWCVRGVHVCIPNVMTRCMRTIFQQQQKRPCLTHLGKQSCINAALSPHRLHHALVHQMETQRETRRCTRRRILRFAWRRSARKQRTDCRARALSGTVSD